jgi:hypothetical protein
MKCPHCLTDFHDNPQVVPITADSDGSWAIISRICSACGRAVLNLAEGHMYFTGREHIVDPINQQYLIRPKASQRPPPPPDVPADFREDYIESCLVLADSPKASAALSRRCLQHLLRECAKVKPGNLADEIQQVIDGGTLPSHIAESIDVIRHIGNFAAHPMKSKASGEVLPVEAGEAEWNLDVIESLFDFYFVQPAITKRKKDALNQKLQEAGKKPMR